VPYREDEDALLARNDDLVRQVEQLTRERDAALSSGKVVVTRTPLWAWIAAGLAVGASVIAIIAATTHTVTPAIVAAPDAAPRVPIDAAPPADAPPPRSTTVETLRGFLDTVDRDLRYVLSAYPDHLPAHAKGSKLDIPRGFVSDDDVDSALAAVAPLARASDVPGLGDALPPYLDHVKAWLPRWRAVALYLRLGDYLDDDLAKLRGEHHDLLQSIQEFFDDSKALRIAVDRAWREQEKTEPKDTARGLFLATWDGCREAAEQVLDHATPDIASPEVVCENGIATLGDRKLADDYTLQLLEQVYTITSSARRGEPADLGSLTQMAIYASAQVEGHLADLSTR
jgi:hypothetical protein